MIEYLPNMRKTLGPITSTVKERRYGGEEDWKQSGDWGGDGDGVGDGDGDEEGEV